MKFSYKKYIFLYLYILKIIYTYFTYIYLKNIYICFLFHDSLFQKQFFSGKFRILSHCQNFFFTFIYIYILSIHYFDIILVCFRVYNFKISYILFI